MSQAVDKSYWNIWLSLPVVDQSTVPSDLKWIPYAETPWLAKLYDLLLYEAVDMSQAVDKACSKIDMFCPEVAATKNNLVPSGLKYKFQAEELVLVEL